MKISFLNVTRKKISILIVIVFSSAIVYGQGAVVSTPLGIGKNCGAGNSTDSFRVLNYNEVTKTLSPIFKCKPNLGGGAPVGPAFSSSMGSVAYNPYDQNVYYIATTNGNNSFVYHWRPDTCHTSNPKQVWSNYYSNQFVVGLDFNPLVPNEGFQLEFPGSSAPYTPLLRKVDFTTNTFGPSDTIILSGGKKIYKQMGDVIFTPSGQLYFAFDNKLFKVDFSNYGSPSKKVSATFIDTLNFGAAGIYITGISYAQGKFIGSTQNNMSPPCAFKEIDISSGSAVISPITLPANNYTATDMATMINGIGVAKRASMVSNNGGNNWLVQYDVSIRNFGNTPLINVQLIDSVAKVFGSAFVSASAAALGTLPPGITMNASYNGITDCKLFTGGPASILAPSPADSARVRITVNLNNPDINAFYYNTAIGTGEGQLFGNKVRDSSNNSPSLLIDPNGNGVPDNIGENVPTPLKLNGWVIVPVNLIDFNARLKTDRSVDIHWKLVNNESVKVEVQRSSDGEHFISIGNVETGVSSGVQEYQFPDKEPISGKYYYRIRIVRPSGSEIYSDVVRINLDATLKPALQVGPVPFSDKIKFTLQLDNNEQISCRLIDFHGRTVYTSEKIGFRGENTFSISELQQYRSGTYVLQIKANNQVYNKMVLKKDR